MWKSLGLSDNILKRRAGHILNEHGVRTGYCILGDIITVHNFNNTGQTFEVDWSGNLIGVRKLAGLHPEAYYRNRTRREYMVL